MSGTYYNLPSISCSNRIPTWPKADKNNICNNLTSYQIDDPKLYYQNPIGGVRLALLNDHNKNKCIQYADKYKMFLIIFIFRGILGFGLSDTTFPIITFRISIKMMFTRF